MDKRQTHFPMGFFSFGWKYVLIAKDNQPMLAEDVADLLADRTLDRHRWLGEGTWEKGHGRIEHRQITHNPDFND